MLAFSFGMTALLMGTMLFFGWVFIKHPPKNINGVYGYRTPRSMQNEDTWMFAHKSAGTTWVKLGVFGTLISMPMIFLFDFLNVLETYAIYLFYMQMILLFLVIPITEYRLKKEFNQDGSRKE